MTGIRQKNSWLHGWAGLLLGWVMFVIFFTGTIAFFRQEVTFWMQPELHQAQMAEPQANAERALDQLQQLAPDAKQWRVELPDERSPSLNLSWKADGVPDQNLLSEDRRIAERNAEIQNAAGGRPRDPGVSLDPATGEILHPRPTAGGNFLYHLHYQLHYMSRDTGMLLVGIATLAMFIAILSGIVTHKKIFKDFFTFRPRKGQRSWLDGHNATAVFALPFHLMITFSGLLLVGGLLLPFGEGGRHGGRGGDETSIVQELHISDSYPLAQVFETAEREWSVGIGRLTFDREANTIEISPTRNDDLLLRPGGGPGRSMTFDAVTGEMTSREDGVSESVTDATRRSLVALHLGRFAPWELRWFFFLAGVVGTVMVGSGLVLWTVKRREKRRGQDGHIGHRLSEALNVGTIAGLSAATAGYFIASRLLPAGMAARPDWEIGIFFAIWALTYAHGAVRERRSAWTEQLSLAGILFLAVPFVGYATGTPALPAAMLGGQWILAGFDLMSFAAAAGLLFAARKSAARRVAGNAARSRDTVASAAVPAE